MCNKTNRAERLLQEYCSQAGIGWTRICEQVGVRTPDYELLVGGRTIIAEVKEVRRSREERKSDALTQPRGYTTRGGKTGARVRNMIRKASPQIKAGIRGRQPGMLVLYDGRKSGHIDPFNIKAAMYGDETWDIAVPQDPTIGPYVTGARFGPNQRMTPNQQTSISAIGVLSQAGEELCVYHNEWADVPIDPRLLTRSGIRQYRIDRATMEWVPTG
ncbi:MAG: hypothetical protein F4X13_01305 [Gammaproteobacteria bacterium]|nr:hypothetical protein [Gammaproteobacteria bacterium]